MHLEEAKTLAELHMEAHTLFDWRFKFHAAKRTIGLCNHTDQTISLSKSYTLLNNEKSIENTILHEIAHALVGYDHGHDWVWKRKALEIGCSGERCAGSEIVKPQGTWKLTCLSCNHEAHMYRKPKLARSCGKCAKGFNPKFLMELSRV